MAGERVFEELKEKHLVSAELHFLVQELKVLEGAKLQRVHQRSEKDFLFDFHIASLGKRYLRLILPNLAFLSQNKPQMPQNPMRMCSLLRKHLEGAFLEKISQLGFERILRLEFRAKSEHYILFAELFSRGNLVFCNSELKILGVAEEQNWSSRKIAPGLEYLPPPKSEDPREVSLENLMRILSRSEKGLAQSLAKELSLGGVYAEEVCLRSGLEKSRNTSSFSAEEAQKIISTIRELFSETLKPCIVFSSGKMVDIIPVPLYYYSGLQFEVLGSFSEGLERAPIPEHSDDSESQLSRIIEEQQRAFNALIERADSSEKKAELIYSHYNEIKAALDFLREESAESSVSEAFDKLMSRFSFVKAVDKKERRITFEFPE